MLSRARRASAGCTTRPYPGPTASSTGRGGWSESVDRSHFACAGSGCVLKLKLKLEKESLSKVVVTEIRLIKISAIDFLSRKNTYYCFKEGIHNTEYYTM